MKRSEILNFPNLLGFYRLLTFPVILWFVISGKQNLFAIFLTINLITDVADGYIARKFNMETQFGARLDALADVLTYLLAITGLLFFKIDDLLPHLISFLAFVGAMALTQFIALAKFGTLPSFHLYSTKIGGYIQGLFFIVLFTRGFFTPLYYLMIAWGILSAVEHVAIQFIIPELRSDVRGLYWVLKERKYSADRVDYSVNYKDHQKLSK